MKTKRIFVRISVLFVALVFPFSAARLCAAAGETVVIGQLKFTALGDVSCKVEAADKGSISGAIVIPATAEINGKSYIVTTIAGSAFESCKEITSVTIESNYLKTIGQRAFLYCSGISDTIFIPESMDGGSSIGIYAFANIFAPIKFLSATPPTLDVSNGLYPQFRDAKHKITIPCRSMATYLANAGWAANGDLLYDPCYAYEMDFEGLHYSFTSFSTATLKGLADGASLEVLDIPATVSCNDLTYNVTAIADSAFIGNSVITKLAIPSTVETIGVRAFNVCTGLVSIQFAQEGVLATVKDRAFLGCKNIKDTVIIPASIAKIEPYAFADWTSLDALQFAGTTPPSLVIAGGVYGQFRDNRATPYKLLIPCNSRNVYTANEGWGTFASRIEDPCVESTFTDGLLSYSLLLGNSVKVDSFASGVSATKLDVPSKVTHKANTYYITSIGVQAFKGKNLTSVSIPSTVVEIESQAFANNYLLEVVTFSEGLSIIRNGAFLNDEKIGRIELPSTVTSIEYSAFGGNTSIDTAFIYSSTPPVIGQTNPFAGSYPIVVACGSLTDYLNADSWKKCSDPGLLGRLVSGCPEITIYHIGSGTKTTFDGGMVNQVTYKRKFTPGKWETLYLPFEVESMTVVENDASVSDINLPCISGVQNGYFYLGTLDAEGNVVFSTDTKLQSKKPYIVYFPDVPDEETGSYYNREVTFTSYVAEQEIPSTQPTATRGSVDKLVGNVTMLPQSIAAPLYLLSVDAKNEFGLKKTEETLYPFECYILPMQETGAALSLRKAMPRFNTGEDDTPTSNSLLQDKEDIVCFISDNALHIFSNGKSVRIYTPAGNLVYAAENENTIVLPASQGCYIICSEGHSQKVVL